MKSKVVLLKLISLLIIGFLAIFSCTNPLIEKLFEEETDTGNLPVAPEIIWTVSFESDGGSNVPSQTVAQGSRASRPGNPTKRYYAFDNWYADSGYTTLFNFNSTIKENTTLYAGWINVDFPGETIHNTFNVSNPAEWNSAASAIENGGDNKNYIINVITDFRVPGVYNPNFGSASGIKVSFRGAGKTLSLVGTGIGNILHIGRGQTFILWDLILQGHLSNERPLVYMRHGNNDGSDGGTFIMHDGKICGNSSYLFVSGVSVGIGGTFIMNGGEISGNRNSGIDSYEGGGVYVYYGDFTMNGGIISGNYVQGNGGGVYVWGRGTFTMNEGKISGNNAEGDGGGVYVRRDADRSSGTFTMYGGEISGNNADGIGGGIYNSGTTRIVTGTIYGNENAVDTSLKNTANQGAALSIHEVSTQAEYGKFSGTEWVRSGDLDTTDNTVRVKDGLLLSNSAGVFF